MKRLIENVDKNRELVLAALDYVWKNPETGYREFKTSKYLEDRFEELGYDIVRAGDIPGFYTVLDTGKPGPEILIMGELDALKCVEHPERDPETDAVHCCGHAAQCAALLGVAAALKEKGALDGLSGRIRLCAVPAEELIEIEYRKELRDKGIIKYFGGKPEFMRRGYFDGVDIAFMIHTTSGTRFNVNIGGVGCIAKQITYKGVSAHAGGSPWNGVNALYAATQGLNAANALRETFKEPDIIRFHPIITQGGTAVNAIPDTVKIESYVRGISFDAIKDANRRINQALAGAALSINANVDICDMPGYAPYKNCPNMIKVFKEACFAGIGEEAGESGVVSSGSTDMGDISCVMPMVHPYAPGAIGRSHGADYMIADPQRACVDSAKVQLAMIHILLSDNASRACQIKADFKPMFSSIKEYLQYLDDINDSGDRITYCDGNASVRI